MAQLDLLGENPDPLVDVPTVINLHHYQRVELPEPYQYIGRGSVLGNPFTKAEHGYEALTKYRAWLWSRLRAGDPPVLEAMREITAAHHLGCYCKPKPCHGDIVVAAWDWLRREGRLGGAA